MAAGLGAFLAFGPSGGAGSGPEPRTRGARYGGRVWPRGPTCTNYPATTGEALRTQAFENAAWVKNGTGVAAASVTENAGTSPDCSAVNDITGCGAATADRIQFAACPVDGNFSRVYQIIAVSAGTPHTAAVYFKGTSGSGTVGLAIFDTTPSTGVYTSAAFNSSTWTRVALSKTVGVAGSNFIVQIGCLHDLATFSGSSNTGAADVLVWQGEMQNAAAITPPIYVQGTAAVRAAVCL